MSVCKITTLILMWFDKDTRELSPKDPNSEIPLKFFDFLQVIYECVDNGC